MSSDSEIRDSLERFIDTKIGVKGKICQVDSVDLVKKTCYCVPVDGSADIFGARLMAQATSGFLIIPEVNSTVIVSFIDSRTAYVSMFSDVSEIQLNGDTYGGLTKTIELQTQLNKLNAQLQALITAATTWVVSPNDGGAAFKVAATAALLGLQPGVFTNITNTTVKHGNGT